MYFNSWGVFVKLAWGVPLSTHTCIVQNLLAKDFYPSKHQVLSKYVNFLRGIKISPLVPYSPIEQWRDSIEWISPNREARILLSIVEEDEMSDVVKNLKRIEDLCLKDPFSLPKYKSAALTWINALIGCLPLAETLPDKLYTWCQRSSMPYLPLPGPETVAALKTESTITWILYYISELSF